MAVLLLLLVCGAADVVSAIWLAYLVSFVCPLCRSDAVYIYPDVRASIQFAHIISVFCCCSGPREMVQLAWIECDQWRWHYHKNRFSVSRLRASIRGSSYV